MANAVKSVQNGNDQLPKVSVIVPYRDNVNEVEQLVDHLTKQTYPSEKTEIILINNGLDNNVKLSAFTSEKIILLDERNYSNSPYSARNRGVEAATGEILVFIDANSYPAESWLEKGIEFLESEMVDIAAGAVQFDYGEKVTAAKITDALTSIRVKEAVSKRNVAYTANLFVRKEVFNKTGLFEEGVRSGGDVRWAGNAVNSGFKIGYAEDAVVYKFARGARELYRKKIRTGRGYFFSWKEEENSTIWFYNFFRSLKPPSFSAITKINEARYQSEFDSKKLGIWFHLYATGVIEQIAFMVQYLSYVLGSQRDIDRREKMKQEHGEKKATE